MKYCSKCRCSHPLSDFADHCSTKDGKQYWCKVATKKAKLAREARKMH